MCQADDQCLYFTWETTMENGTNINKCWMKSEFGQIVKDRIGYTSGPKVCDIITEEEGREEIEMEGEPTCFLNNKAILGKTVFYTGTEEEYVEACPGPKHCQVLYFGNPEIQD